MLKKMMFVMCFLLSIVASYGMESMSENPENTAGKNNSELKWPGIAYDGDAETESLRKYHARLEHEGGCQLPQNQEEFDWVYAQYKAGNFKNDLGFHSWHFVMMVMGDELTSRLETGSMFLINRYLDRIEGFMMAVAKCEDRNFIDPLFHPIFFQGSLLHVLIEDGVDYAYACQNKDLFRGANERALTIKDVEDVVKRLNDICNRSQLFEQNVMQVVYNAEVEHEKARGNVY